MHAYEPNFCYLLFNPKFPTSVNPWVCPELAVATGQPYYGFID